MKNYVISTLVVIALMLGGVCAGSAQLAVFNAADTHELLAFQLNDDLVQRYHNATMAFIEWGKAHQNEKSKMDDDTTTKKMSDVTISDMTANLTRHPEVQAVFLSKGITPRQYIETMIVLMPGLAMVTMEREGHPSAKGSPVVSAPNLDYIRKNYDHLSKVLDEMSGPNQ
jgi:hypothetical protein